MASDSNLLLSANKHSRKRSVSKGIKQGFKATIKNLKAMNPFPKSSRKRSSLVLERAATTPLERSTPRPMIIVPYDETAFNPPPLAGPRPFSRTVPLVPSSSFWEPLTLSREISKTSSPTPSADDENEALTEPSAADKHQDRHYDSRPLNPLGMNPPTPPSGGRRMVEPPTDNRAPDLNIGRARDRRSATLPGTMMPTTRSTRRLSEIPQQPEEEQQPEVKQQPETMERPERRGKWGRNGRRIDL